VTLNDATMIMTEMIAERIAVKAGQQGLRIEVN